VPEAVLSGIEAVAKGPRKFPKRLYVCLMPEPAVAFGPFLLSADNGTLFREGKPVAIGQRGTLLLGTLLKSRGEVVTKAALMDAAWPDMAVEESNLSVQIASLRKRLGPTPDGGEWIVTIPRIGYRFVGEPKAAVDVVIQPGGLDSAVPSLAVLPFQNLSGDPGHDYFADGIVEDIITALSRFKSFAVIARNSSFVYRGRAIDVRHAAKDLGVRYVLEGSVRRMGGRLRISAQLVDGLTGMHLWARNFDGTLDEVFDFQDRITESVATVVEPHIQTAEIERARHERPESIAAYDLYLRALSKREDSGPEANAAAYDLLSEALHLEPDNSVFLANAARALHHRSLMGWKPIGRDDNQKCAELARRALQHAAGDATVMAYCGDVLLHVIKDYDWAMAVLQFAVAANPNNLQVVIHAGIVDLHCGNVEDALAHFHRAIRLNPGDPSAHLPLVGIAHVHMIRGDYDEALVWATRALAVSPNNHFSYWMLIAASALLGRMGEAHRFLKEFRKIAPAATIATIWAGQPQKDPSRCANIFEGLHIAGLAES
jgi:TolB-like protein/Tfp pilus assembly protein PilF